MPGGPFSLGYSRSAKYRVAPKRAGGKRYSFHSGTPVQRHEGNLLRFLIVLVIKVIAGDSAMSTDANKRLESDADRKVDGRSLMPDIYAEEFVVEETTLEVVGESSTEFDESGGFDPYDTATLYKK